MHHTVIGRTCQFDRAKWVLFVAVVISGFGFPHATATHQHESKLIGGETIQFPIGDGISNGGYHSFVAMNKHHHVIVVYEKGSSELHYRLGYNSGITVNWHQSEDAALLLEKHGAHPAVALSDENGIVVVFTNNNNLWLRAGRLNDNAANRSAAPTLDLSPPVEYGKGTIPSVGLTNDGAVIVTHQDGHNLYYLVGTLSKNSQPGQHQVMWNSQALQLGQGSHSRVAVNNHKHVVFVNQASHGGSAIHHQLVSRAGKLEAQGVNWAGPEKGYARGSWPSVAINDENLVVQAHQSIKQDKGAEVYSMMGHFRTDNNNVRVDWESNIRFDIGHKPTVAMTNHKAVSMFEGPGLWMSMSLVFDRSRWMELMPEIYDKELWQITMAGTHDSGAFSLSRHRARKECVDASQYIPGFATENFAAAQDQDFLSQLRGGIRFFDIRPYYWKKEASPIAAVRDVGRKRRSFGDWVKKKANDAKNTIHDKVIEPTKQKVIEPTKHFVKDKVIPETKKHVVDPVVNKAKDIVTVGDDDFHAYHDNIGPKLSKIFDHVAEFMRFSKSEVVFIQISHFCRANFSQDLHKRLTDLIKEKLGAFLFKRPEGQNLLKIKIGEYLKEGSKVVLIYYNDYAATAGGTAEGFWSDLSKFDRYANSDQFDIMKDDQRKKLDENQPSDQQLFLLSWTLTITGKVKKTLHLLTMDCNRHLAQFIESFRLKQRVNIIYVDCYQESGAVDSAILMNKIHHGDKSKHKTS